MRRYARLVTFLHSSSQPHSVSRRQGQLSVWYSGTHGVTVVTVVVDRDCVTACTKTFRGENRICMFADAPSPPHPRTSAVAGVVETLRGVGEESRAAVRKVEKLAVRAVGAPLSKRAPAVGAHVQTLAGAGKKLTVTLQQIPECAVRCVAAACHPAPAAILRTFHTVFLHIDTHEFSAQVYYLWHNIIFFRLNILFALPHPADISGTPCPHILHNVSATESGEREKERQAHHLSPYMYVHKQE